MNEIIQLFIEKYEWFFKLSLQHIQLCFISSMVAIILGMVMGILIEKYEKSSKLVLSFINLLYTIPSIAMLGFLIPFSGIGDNTAIIALSIYALLPMVRNTYTGLKQVDEQVIEAAKGMGSTELQILTRIKLPLAMPVILSGLRNMITMTIALAGIASFIGAGGLGVAIYRGITTNNVAMTFLGSMLIALLAIVVDMLLGFIEKRLFQRNKRATKKKRMIITLIVICIAFLGFSSISLFSNKKQTINIATKPMSEQYIIGEILEILIEQETDLDVKLTSGVGGGTSNIAPAMASKEFDMYPEYTGTGWNNVLGYSDVYHETMFDKLQKDYHSIHQTWAVMLGFNNTYGLAVRKDIADTYNLKTYSDLAKVSNELRFGAEYDFFERLDGYDALSSAYAMNFSSTMDLDIGLKYEAIKQGEIDVMNIFTTDGQLANANVVVLQDDQNFYPSYTCGIVVREEVLKKYPEVLETLLLLDNKLSEEDIAHMNYEVEINKKDPRKVASKWLEKEGLLME